MSVQLLTYVLPLVTLPFLTRVLGPREWGQLAFAEGYAAYLSIVIEYGFGLSATREVAQMRDSTQRRSSYLSNVLGAQVLLGILTVALTGIGVLIPGALASYRPMLPLAMMLGFCRSIFPLWYFQGLERLKIVSLLNILFGIAITVVILVFVRSSGDGKLVLGLRVVAALLSAVAALAIAYREIPMVSPTVRGVLLVLKEGRSLFLFRGIVSLYTTANVLLIGIIGTPLAVAWFAGAEKLCKACLSGLGPITQAFYPHISYLVKHNPADAAKATRLSVYFTVGAGAAAGLFLGLFAPIIVPILLGPKFGAAVPILRVMSILPPLIATSNVFGIQWMVALRMEKVFSWILAAAAVVNIILALLLTPRYGALGMALSMVVAETVVTGGIIVYLRIKNLDPWRIATADQELVAA